MDEDTKKRLMETTEYECPKCGRTITLTCPECGEKMSIRDLKKIGIKFIAQNGFQKGVPRKLSLERKNALRERLPELWQRTREVAKERNEKRLEEIIDEAYEKFGMKQNGFEMDIKESELRRMRKELEQFGVFVMYNRQNYDKPVVFSSEESKTQYLKSKMPDTIGRPKKDKTFFEDVGKKISSQDSGFIECEWRVKQKVLEMLAGFLVKSTREGVWFFRRREDYEDFMSEHYKSFKRRKQDKI